MWDELRHALTSAVARHEWTQVVTLAHRLENLANAHEGRCRGPAAVSEAAVLVTGAAGFIGSHLVRRLLESGHHVVGVDDFNDYYDPVCKYENVAPFLRSGRFALHELDVRDREALRAACSLYPIDRVVHLAARAGVRPSIRDPQLYVTANVIGTQNLLELARERAVRGFVYASSSSVYGGSLDVPFVETQPVDRPISPYAATKKANELQASCYGRLYGFPVVGLRFFTVYGPGGRPDMAIRMFIEAMDRGEPVTMFGDGSFARDFTYVDDVVDGILGALKLTEERPARDEVYNLGESDTTTVRELILLIAKELGRIKLERDVKDLGPEETLALVERLVAEGAVRREPEQPGDVPCTWADVSEARQQLGYAPQTRIAEGIRKTVLWHRERKARATDPLRERIYRAIRVRSALRRRAGLDSLGRQNDPAYGEDDAAQLMDACQSVAEVADSLPGDPLPPRIAAGLCALLGEAAAYLGGVAAGRLQGLDALSVQRDRRRMIAIVRAGGFSGMKPGDEEELLATARRIVRRTGERRTAVVVAAAGYGTRVADEVGGYEMKHRLFLGDEMLLLSLRNFLPYSRRVVAVVSEKNRPDVAGLLDRSEIAADHGYEVEYVVQVERLGDGDAHLCAAEILDGSDGIILFVFADAPTKSPETIEKMVLLKQALGELVPLVVPCFLDDQPYSPIVLRQSGPDRGRVVWNWQKADEEDYPEARTARQGRALRNVGIFAAEASVFPALRRFKDDGFARTGRYRAWQEKLAAWRAQGAPLESKPKEPEFGFADLMKVLPGDGIEVAAACLAKASDKLNVNEHDDAEAVKQLYRDRYPLCRPMIERRPERGEVIVRFYGLDAQANVVRVNGLPSVRNYTRLRFPDGIDGAEVQRALERHIETLGDRIAREVGLTVLDPLEGFIQ